MAVVWPGGPSRVGDGMTGRAATAFAALDCSVNYLSYSVALDLTTRKARAFRVPAWAGVRGNGGLEGRGASSATKRAGCLDV